MTRVLEIPLKVFPYILAVSLVILFRLIKPLLLVRWGVLISSRIGHFGANTELYLCEREAGVNVPDRRYIDIFYMENTICNQQLAVMWKRILRIWPYWLMARVERINRMVPGGADHEIGNNAQHDRDVLNLLDRFPPHLHFTAREEARGQTAMRAMGIPQGARFVCLMVRDNAYLNNVPGDWSPHDYRNSNIQNYILASEELANRGYYVVRMGSLVGQAMNADNPRIIDYAVNGHHSEFMDIYLGAKCELCVATGTGWDLVPGILFRRPTLYTNLVPLGYIPSYSDKFMFTTKRHVVSGQGRELTLTEIFSRGVGFCLETSGYTSKGVELIESTPEEIREAVMEIVDRLEGTWQSREDDEELQQLFWRIFPAKTVDAYRGRPLHGEIRARFGTVYLRKNRGWLQ